MYTNFCRQMGTGLMMAALFLLIGCGSKMHTIKVDSMPSGAKMVLDGKSLSDTPGNITVKKDGKKHYLFIRKNGCEEFGKVFKANQYPKEMMAQLNCPPPAGGQSDADSLARAGLDEDKLGDKEGPLASPRDRFENENVYFGYDSSALTPEARETLQFKAQWLRDNPGTLVIIEGHTDERGTVEYNLALGERRAKSAKDFLMTLGLPESRLTTISYGEELPSDPGQNETAWAANRRAHFVIQ